MIECVPNVSEGRRVEVVADMADAIRHVRGVRLLDFSSDPSHNRSVFTFVGGAAAIELAVLALYERAVAAIDLRTHRGEHPRLGAVDVVPLIPLDGTTMDECVALARTIGRSVAERFNVPVYLYEEASANPARKHLEDIRRGGFENLPFKMVAESWTPDFGPASPHPTAGASVIGARAPLVAYNVNLASDRIEVARAIARSIRQSNGGLRHVKALGIALADRGLVQVSMNLTNYEETPIEEVFDAVEREAARFGVEIADSEIVGLIPEAALKNTTAAHLRLRNFGDDQVLEHRLKGRSG